MCVDQRTRWLGRREVWACVCSSEDQVVREEGGVGVCVDQRTRWLGRREVWACVLIRGPGD